MTPVRLPKQELGTDDESKSSNKQNKTEERV